MVVLMHRCIKLSGNPTRSGVQASHWNKAFAMLCFLPMVPAWREPESPPRPSSGLAGFAIAAIVLLAVLTPFGWVHPEPVYAAQVGVAVRFAPRAEDAGLMDRLERAIAPAAGPRKRYAYFVRGQHDDSLPPGSRSIGGPVRSAAYQRSLGLTR